MTRIFLISLLSLTLFSGYTQLSPRIANYEIDLILDIQDKKIYADQIIKWKNTSEGPVSELYFHLYYNAFKNTETTFFKESGLPSFLMNEDEETCPWAWTNISSIIDASGNQLADQMQYVSLDDGNENDQTVLKVSLANPIPPGQTAVYTMKWEAKIPNIMPRTGYNKDFYFFAQWFPKLGVYETAGTRYAEMDQWNCHQYHSRGEYYADFGNYKVSMTVPKSYEVGASGSLVNKEASGDGVKWTFEVEDVIDFAWGTSPEFVLQEEQWNDVTIKLYTYPNHVNCTQRFFDVLKFTLEYLDTHLGKYPYKTISIIDPPIHGMFTGGMEYPTLITSLSFCFLPTGFKSTETLTVHEFIHQYFMQMVATHEQEEPWMDEGFTTYYEGRILDAFYNKKNSFVDIMGITIGSSEFNRGEFLSSGVTKLAPNTCKSREFVHGGYGEISYNKTAIWLKTLEGILGTEVFDKTMKEYFETWKFKHPCGRDFESIVNEVVQAEFGDEFGSNMNWFFDQVLRGTNECDYELASVSNETIKSKNGFFDSLDACEKIESEKETTQAKVILKRNGELIFPLEVMVQFEDGTKVVEQWSGEERSYEFNYNKKVVSATIDPDQKIYLDKNFLNNSYVIKSKQRSSAHYFEYFFRSIQNIFQSVSWLI